MADLVREVQLAGADLDHREWLVANGLGGYASGTVGGALTRRYHGHLIAALPTPSGRLVMLNHVVERIDGKELRLVGFRTEWGLPVWRYEGAGALVEKRVVVPYRQNITHVQYRLLDAGGKHALEIEPLIHFRPIEATVSEPIDDDTYILSALGDRYEISTGATLPPLRLKLAGERVRLLLSGGSRCEMLYSREAERGYDARGPLWSPGVFSAELEAGHGVVLIAGAEPWSTIEALDPDEILACELERRRRLVAEAHPAVRDGFAAELVLAADQFIFTPVGRKADVARAQAFGDEIRSVIAGYHWFTDWGRDTMISLEGLALATGRPNEAGWILRTFAHYVRDGLIPNMFPEGRDAGLYHTADATLWFFHALDRYLTLTGDMATLRRLLPTLRSIVEHHVTGTRFGIGVDPADGLLRQGAEGYQLTWMDAKVDDWVVTPRRGKAVEINALWYNALRLLESWHQREGEEQEACAIRERAAQARTSFNRRFWYEEGGHLYDVVDGERGDDPACRPNQIFAVALPHPVLDENRWESVVETCRQKLLTPVGLRSLAPGHPDYKPKYFGNLRARDAAYHQGTVWGWLIGPFVDAWLKLHPDDHEGARRFLTGFAEHLSDFCVGSIAEIFDAEAPFAPRGCVAQAWSVAEVLRCWVKTS